MKSTKEMVLKKRKVTIPKGTEFKFKWSTDNPEIVELSGDGQVFKTHSASLPKYFNIPKEPSVSTLNKWSDTGTAKSILGHKVEPDGFDSEGSPSWLLVLGYI